MHEFRTVALSLPGAFEQDHFGSPSFRVNKKIFAQLSADEAEGLVKLLPALQEQVLLMYPHHSWPEPHWGRYGWTRASWRNLPAGVVADLLKQSWRAIAPPSLRGIGANL